MVYVLSFTFLFFFFNDTATTEIYTLSLHDALPIYSPFGAAYQAAVLEEADYDLASRLGDLARDHNPPPRSEEHTSELQSRQYLVCRLLLEKKKNYAHSVARSAHLRHALIVYRSVTL